MIHYDCWESKIGLLKLGYEKNRVVSLSIVKQIDFIAESTDFSQKVFKELEEYFCGVRKHFTIDYCFIAGTDFQKKVWQALAEIPYGEVRSYKEIAIAIGQEKAYRAVGSACNKNPIMILIPCHRVLGRDLSLTGFGGGIDKKALLLDLEKAEYKRQ